jgi:hypothetical protein
MPDSELELGGSLPASYRFGGDEHDVQIRPAAETPAGSRSGRQSF